jgi:hypothetical protein
MRPVRRLWILNFDADEELARPIGYAPSAAVLARFGLIASRLVGLVPEEDAVLEEWNPHLEVAHGDFEGRAFCPTPRALRALAAAGAAIAPAPTIEVLAKVNHRAFCAELGQCLPHARFVRTREELEATLVTTSQPWLLKRPFGFAGRGRQKLRDGAIDAAVEPFVRASIASGQGLQVEPWVNRTIDVALHGFLEPSGAVTLGQPTLQQVDDSGAWVQTTPVPSGALLEDELEQLVAEARRSADALARAGYFGPFGIDAFGYHDRDGRRCFNPRSEINARYSMGWAIGMGDARPDLITLAGLGASS